MHAIERRRDIKVAVESFDSSEFSFADLYPALEAMRRGHRREVRLCEKAFHIAREFRKRYIEPCALELDLRLMEDPNYLDWDLVQKACDYKFYSFSIPKLAGGQGYPMSALLVLLEELSAGCLGIANMIGVNYLGFTVLSCAFDSKALVDISHKTVEGERSGRPYLLSTAITEPSAGSDVEDPEEYFELARLSCEARPVKGGYLINGRKCFISNGSFATDHLVCVAGDRKNPCETFMILVVGKDTKGFSLGRTELKMGQKTCPATELVFEDCFVPERCRLGVLATKMAIKKFGPKAAVRPIRYVLAATRAGVGAFGTGVARGAYERALRYAKTHRINGELMIEQQWVKFRLAQMLRNVMSARAQYMEAIITNDVFGLTSAFLTLPLRALSFLIPRWFFQSLMYRSILKSPPMQWWMAKKGVTFPLEHVQRSGAQGDAAKIYGTDVGVYNSHLAIELMGTDGLRHDRGMEKLFRDAKLLQIYEGTNQINTIDLYRNYIERV